MKKSFVWFFVYWFLLDRMIALGYVNTFMKAIKMRGLMPERTYVSIYDIVWSLPELPGMWAIFDVWLVVLSAWMLVVSARPLSRHYMYLFWWVMILWFLGGIAFRLYTRFIAWLAQLGVIEGRRGGPLFGRWYYHPYVMLFTWFVLSFQATKLLRYMFPVLFWQTLTKTD